MTGTKEESKVNEHKKQQFETDMGQKVFVQRDDIKGELVKRCKDELYTIGKNIQQTDEALKVSDYMGSFTVHIYAAPKSQHIFYVNTMVNGDIECPETVASSAITDLRNYLMKQYGRSPKKKRSGF